MARKQEIQAVDPSFPCADKTLRSNCLYHQQTKQDAWLLNSSQKPAELLLTILCLIGTQSDNTEPAGIERLQGTSITYCFLNYKGWDPGSYTWQAHAPPLSQIPVLPSAAQETNKKHYSLDKCILYNFWGPEISAMAQLGSSGWRSPMKLSSGCWAG